MCSLCLFFLLFSFVHTTFFFHLFKQARILFNTANDIGVAAVPLPCLFITYLHGSWCMLRLSLSLSDSKCSAEKTHSDVGRERERGSGIERETKCVKHYTLRTIINSTNAQLRFNCICSWINELKLNKLKTSLRFKSLPSNITMLCRHFVVETFPRHRVAIFTIYFHLTLTVAVVTRLTLSQSLNVQKPLASFDALFP